MSNREKKTVLFAFGTRPEAIKLAPVIRAFQADEAFDARVCVTAQHRELLDQFLDFFRLEPEFDLDLMSPDQSLPGLASKAIAACADVFERLRPDLIFVQGDTTSAFSAALAASLCKIPVAHIEAGLRSHQKYSPFPEEINRVLIGHLSSLHFAPGAAAAENLRREGITQGVHVVGNPIVDALKLALRTLSDGGDDPFLRKFPHAVRGRKVVLVTLHRRESFGRPLADICGAVRDIAADCSQAEIFYPVHPNPRVRVMVYEMLSDIENIHLLDPLSYGDFVWLLSRAALVISDSGGVLEEAETLGLPVLVAREVTERVEALAAGNARLVGSDPVRIFTEAKALLDAAPNAADPHRTLRHTFGDGQASARIVQATRDYLSVGPANPESIP
jgi:UDP-N-acetylglucosamine 2-epimerase (non-hydrolysing)